MKRIDTANARPNVNGAGKKGFHDNADVSGQDATYLDPSWCNHVQEELCNLLEKNGITLNPNQLDQVYQLLATEKDIYALAEAVQQKLDQEKLLRSNADNALQANIDNKYDKTGGSISGNVSVDGDLDVNGTIYVGDYQQANNESVTSSSYTYLPNGFLMQFGFIAYTDMSRWQDSDTDERIFNLVFPKAFQQCFSLTATMHIYIDNQNTDINNDTWAQVGNVTNTGAEIGNQTGNGSQRPFRGIFWQAIGN